MNTTDPLQVPISPDALARAWRDVEVAERRHETALRRLAERSQALGMTIDAWWDAQGYQGPVGPGAEAAYWAMWEARRDEYDPEERMLLLAALWRETADLRYWSLLRNALGDEDQACGPIA